MFLICLIISLTAAIAGFRDYGIVLGIALPAVFSALYWFFRKAAAGLFLVLSAGGASAGILTGADPAFMILFAGLSLACWDLAALENLMDEYKDRKDAPRYRSIRIKTLLSAIGGGLCTALLFHFIRFRISFTLMFFLSIAAFYFLLRIFGLLRRK